MATPSTVAAWALNGVKVEFDVTFDYLSRTFVKLTLIGAVPRVLVLGTDYEFISPTRVRTFVTYGPPQYQLLEVRRETSTTERLVEFHDASILTASDMNTADLQVLHVAEEARNAATETIGVNADGHLDARGRRIVNLADPVGPLDAANKQYIDSKETGANQAMLAAQAARDAAIVARDASQASASASAGSASASASSASQSAASASTANTHKNAAQAAASASQGSATASEGSASASAASASASKASELKSKDWAEKLPGPVESGAYSAKYWAQQAAAGVIPENSITAMKLPLWNSANVIPDHNFWDLGGAWNAPSGGASSQVVSNPTRGRGLRVDVQSLTGTAGAFAWDIQGRRFKVYQGRPINFAALVESGIAPGQSAASGEVAVSIDWTDEQGTGLGGAMVRDYFTPGQQMGDVSAWATPPSGAVYGHIRVRARYSSSGTWSGFFILYRPQAFMQVPIYQASVSMASLDASLQNTINTHGTDISQLKSDTSGLRTDLNSTTSALSQLDGRENTRWGQTVRKVNGATPDLEGNVTVAGGVPLDAYGTVGECMTLAVRCPTILTESKVVIHGVGGVQLNRLRLAGNPGSPVLSWGVVPGGSYRLLSVISVVVMDGVNVQIWSVQRTA